ncbi:MAG: hypothetical protein GYA62_00045, partial [Bacteroidales bacterium]|nr:hypothetical protein [Bacteroidales bacterium]
MDFKKAYQRQAVIEYLQNEFLPEDFIVVNQPVQVDVDFSYSKHITLLGRCSSLALLVFEIQHRSQRDARVALSRDAFRLLSMFDENRALVLFVPENAYNYRLSLVTITPVIDEQGVKIQKQYSNSLRYSFLLGVDAKTHTPEQFLIKKGRVNSVDDLLSRFSVEVVNREFYQGITALFSDLVGGKRQQGNKTIEYEGKLKLPGYDFSKNEQLYKEFAVRLIGRTVFCWFLKKKISIKGIPLIPDELLSFKSIEQQTNIYHNIIEPLFFEILNTSIEKRKDEYKKAPYNQIPFLNGGLFEPHLFDFYDNGQTNYGLKIPDEWWKEFIQFLETYNFTIDENTSIDIDLSVDPEMLGRIFENLLAEINPETGDTARKSTGSFYTPRAIVEFMVDESIKQFLAQQLETKPQTFDKLLDYTQESSGLMPEQEQKVLQAIQKMKILDPACGSGAFPMGMLQKILLILQKVDHKAQSSIDTILNEITDPIQRKLLKQKLEAAHLLDDIDFEDYARKLSVIKNNIFGVDIQPIAVEISRLRFFLSLIVDEVIQDEQPNRGVEALPNLDFKFVCANSLIRLPEIQQYQLFDDYQLLNNLEQIRAEYFTANNDEKKQLRKDFEQIQQQIYQSLIQNPFSSSDPNSKFMLLANWKPFSNEATTWFDPTWMFGVKDGFDIIIGNPPYISTKGVSDQTKKLFEEQYGFADDTYNHFFFKGIELLKDGGILSYISSKTFWTIQTKKNLRELLLKNTLWLIYDTANPFASAMVDTCITIVQKQQPDEQHVI